MQPELTDKFYKCQDKKLSVLAEDQEAFLTTHYGAGPLYYDQNHPTSFEKAKSQLIQILASMLRLNNLALGNFNHLKERLGREFTMENISSENDRSLILVSAKKTLNMHTMLMEKLSKI